jgi:hypothetical protein
MVEDNASGKSSGRAVPGLFAAAASLFLLVGSSSAVAQAIVLPSVETKSWPLFVLWVVTAVFYLAGVFMLTQAREPLFLGIFFVVSALTAVALVGIIATYVLTSRVGVSSSEYFALGSYAFFLGVIVMMVLVDLQRV